MPAPAALPQDAGPDERDDERIAADLARRSGEALRAELAGALQSLPPYDLEIILLRDFELAVAAIAPG